MFILRARVDKKERERGKSVKKERERDKSEREKKKIVLFDS